MTTTRGSLRRPQSSWPWPTSSATTRLAPRLSSTSVNPPVDAPMSSASRPSTAMPNVSSACASLMPPRPTYGWSGSFKRDRRHRRRPGMPAFWAGWPLTSTTPERIERARALARRREARAARGATSRRTFQFVRLMTQAAISARRAFVQTCRPQRGNGVVVPLGGETARRFEAVDGGIGRLAGAGILAGGLAEVAGSRLRRRGCRRRSERRGRAVVRSLRRRESVRRCRRP